MPLKVVKRKDRAGLWITGTIAGRRVRESAGTDDAGLAEEKRATLEARLYRVALHGEGPPKVTFAAAALSYLKYEPRSAATKHRLGRIVRCLGPAVTCAEIGQAALDRVAEALVRPGSSPATRLREVITPARAILQHAAFRGWCAPPHFQPVPPAIARTDWLMPAQATALIGAAAEHLRPLITFLICTGARLSEALELDWADVSLEHRRVILRQTKGRIGRKRDRIVDNVPPRAIAALSALTHRSGKVFRKPGRLNRDGIPQLGLPYADKGRAGGGQIRSGWNAACERAGLPGAWRHYHRTTPITTGRYAAARGDGVHRVYHADITPHACRHTWASWHYAQHKDLLRLKHDGGWEEVSMVERYAHLVPDGMAAEITAWLAGGADEMTVSHQTDTTHQRHSAK